MVSAIVLWSLALTTTAFLLGGIWNRALFPSLSFSANPRDVFLEYPLATIELYSVNLVFDTLTCVITYALLTQVKTAKIGTALVLVIFDVALAYGCAVGGLFAAFSLGPLLMSIVPIGFVVIGVVLFKKMKKKMDSLEDGPVDTVPAVIIDKRTLVTSGSGNSSSHTSYFITCEAEDGERKEYQVWDGNMYGRLTADDAEPVPIAPEKLFEILESSRSTLQRRTRRDDPELVGVRSKAEPVDQDAKQVGYLRPRCSSICVEFIHHQMEDPLR